MKIIDLWFYRQYRQRIEYAPADELAQIIADLYRANAAAEKAIEICKPRFRSRLQETYRGWWPDDPKGAA